MDNDELGWVGKGHWKGIKTKMHIKLCSGAQFSVHKEMSQGPGVRSQGAGVRGPQ